MAVPGVSVSVSEGGVRIPYSFERDTEGKLTFEQEVEFLKQAKIGIAKDVLREEIRNKTFPEEYTRFVDNSRNKPLEAVTPFGPIEFVNGEQDIGEALLGIARTINKFSPVGVNLPGQTKKYIDFNIVFFNGELVARNFRQLRTFVENELPNRNVSFGDLFRFVNISPYARRLERKGVIGKRFGSKVRKVKSKYRRSSSYSRLARANVQVARESGAYYVSARAAKRQYKGSGFIDFKWLSGAEIGISDIERIASGNSRQKFRTTFKTGSLVKGSAGRPYVYPSIRLKVTDQSTSLDRKRGLKLLQ